MTCAGRSTKLFAVLEKAETSRKLPHGIRKLQKT
jgi:hypothetical protein